MIKHIFIIFISASFCCLAQSTKILDNEKLIALKDNPIECSTCELIIKLADFILKKNKTDQEIIGDLQLVCNLFHGDTNVQNVDDYFVL
jgi:hypothetical protein